MHTKFETNIYLLKINIVTNKIKTINYNLLYEHIENIVFIIAIIFTKNHSILPIYIEVKVVRYEIMRNKLNLTD